MGGVGQPGWSGGVLFESLDAAAFAIADETTNEAAWGFCQTVLGSTPTPFQTDRVNILTVGMTTGADRLHSVSELAMLNGANRALLIDPDGTVEVIAFATVTPNDFGSFTLSTLLRGLRGTEGFVGSHVVGALFVLLEETTLNRILLPLAELDTVRHYRGVGRGGQLSDAFTQSVIPAGRDLMPYAPVHLRRSSGAWGANITLAWIRQTRIGGEWVDSFADTMLAEDTEAYELEILDGPGGSVLRTETGIASSSFIYTTAMQGADFGGAQSQLSFRVYQISAQVGRGFPGANTVDVT
jgi:hypothetical protein